MIFGDTDIGGTTSGVGASDGMDSTVLFAMDSARTSTGTLSGTERFGANVGGLGDARLGETKSNCGSGAGMKSREIKLAAGLCQLSSVATTRIRAHCVANPSSTF